MKTIIWGTGKILENNIHQINLSDVICFVDSDCKKQGTEYKGKKIISPEEIKKYTYDFIVISSTKYFGEISKQLVLELGVSIYKVINLDYYMQVNHGLDCLYPDKLKNLIFKFCKIYDYHKIFDADTFLQKKMWSQEIEIDTCYKGNRKEEISFLYSKVWSNYESIDEIYDLNLVMENISIQCLSRYLDKFKCSLVFFTENTERYFNQFDDFVWEKCNIEGYLFALVLSKKEDVVIYEITHKIFTPINEKSYVPLYVGKIKDENISYIRDDSGDNISNWNDKINECTGLYWFWKNTDYGYVGLNHYRRFFSSPLNQQVMLQQWEINRLMQQYDIVVAERADYGTGSIKVALSNTIDEEAFNIVYKKIFDIFEKKSETDKAAFHYVFEGPVLFPCNIFITSREILNEYCSWLFPILEELIETVEIKEEWDNYSKRVIGFFAERLLTVWLMQHKYRIKELPIILVGNDKSYGK